jgi:hypothetical protein
VDTMETHQTTAQCGALCNQPFPTYKSIRTERASLQADLVSRPVMPVTVMPVRVATDTH